jgi:sulfonate transport system substrate-binding protein
MLRHLAATLIAMTVAGGALAEDKPAKVSMDWATYNPVSVALKAKGFLDEEMKKDGIAVEWTKSGGSNVSIGFLNSGKIDFGSTAGAAALVAKIDGAAIKTVYVFSKPEWTALVVKPDSAIKTISDLKGKRVAAARGTDPHIFLTRALAENGVAPTDVTVVVMAHANGKAAMEAGDVDAWAGLDPLMAEAEVKGTGKLVYRNADFNTYGVLSVTADFATKYPTAVKRVLAAYEQARLWSMSHPDELLALMVEATGMPKEVVAKQLAERTDLKDPVVGAKVRSTIQAAGVTLQKVGALNEKVDVAATLDAMLDPTFLPKAAQ